MFGFFLSSQIERSVWKLATSLVIVGLVTGCVVWRSDDPRLVRGVRPEIPETSDAVELKRYAEARRKQIRAVLEKQVGEPFPDLTLIDTAGNAIRLSSFRGRRVAILAAIGPVAPSNKWIEELADQEWELSGFDELIVLVSHGQQRSWSKQIRQCPNAYLVGWPLEGFLAEWNIYPTMYAVGANGTFEGSWLYGQPPPARPAGDARRLGQQA